MGTQRFRQSTLPALGRLTRRVVSQRRLPAHVIRHTRTRLRHRLTALWSALRRLSPARRRAIARAPEGAVVVRSVRGWKAATPNTATSAGELVMSFLDEAAGAFDAAGVPWFVTEPQSAVGYRLGVFDEHRGAALEALGSTGLLTARAPSGRQAALGEPVAKGPTGTAPRVVAWRHHHLGRDVVTGPRLGVTVEFWRDEPVGRVVAEGRVGIAGFNPEPLPDRAVEIRGRSFDTYRTFADEIEASRLPFEVDMVYTWVDGSDPAWQRDYDSHLTAAGRLNPEAANRSRYEDRDELRYSFRSLWWNADFFRNAYLVTSGHVPAWLADHPRLTVVHHRDILPAEVLPTFNSHAIEASLHRIDGLAEHYVYMNDDVFFGRPVTGNTFYERNGLARMQMSTAAIPPGPAHGGDLPVDAAAKNGRELLRAKTGYAPARKLAHSPHPQIKSVVEEVEAAFPDVVQATRAARFRSLTDVSLASSLAQHYAFATGRAMVGRLESLYINIANRWAPAQLGELLRLRDREVFCLNETSMLGAREVKVTDLVIGFLQDYFPKPSPFEK